MLKQDSTEDTIFFYIEQDNKDCLLYYIKLYCQLSKYSVLMWEQSQAVRKQFKVRIPPHKKIIKINFVLQLAKRLQSFKFSMILQAYITKVSAAMIMQADVVMKKELRIFHLDKQAAERKKATGLGLSIRSLRVHHQLHTFLY